ncbi:TonB-dependent receptor [Algoriphagus limi]|uniref:Carboxypeptidase-like regulatory domain-containing protein n=1 Tax=Algoriphagus limi TaxID=2975273 RepID=A0ABT2G8H7_9BACT|nr:TonB-dependent receptor [Algoriphagus limi]MCS5491580.1 carboxypeptidase-like regulatory domain-containing protein [Algoriphagus limi]
MKYIRFLIFLLLLLGWGVPDLLAQTSQKFSGFFAGISFERFVERIESESDYRFIYSKQDLSGFSVNIQANDSELKDLLETLFSDTEFKFSIAADHRVFITRGEKLTVNFTRDYFEPKALSDGNAAASRGTELGAFAKNMRFEIGRDKEDPSRKTAILSGKVTNIDNGEPMLGTVIFEKVDYNKTITDTDGNYKLELPIGRHTIFIQNPGGYQEQRQIELFGDGVLDMEVQESFLSLDEIVVSSGALNNINKLDLGVQSISIADVRKLPAVLGEVDILKGVLTMPGVNTVGEASVGFNVRGGAADQNLILYNQSTIFNPSHVFGFFSAFNPDMVSGVELYKGSVPVNYGGRLSSVLQVEPKFGRSDKIGGSGGIGIMTGRLSLEGPIGEKTTFIIGGRTTYSNWALDLLDDEAALEGSSASFYDLNANIRHEFNEKNQLEITSYLSKDDFAFDLDTTYSYENLNLAATWRHFFNEQLEGKFTVGSDNYQFGIIGADNPLNAYQFQFDVSQLHLRGDFEYRKGENHIYKFGIHGIQYELNPGTNSPYGPESIVIPEDLEDEKAREISVYFGDEWTISEQLSVSFGGRYMFYQLLGPLTVNQYVPDAPITDSNVIGEETFGPGESVQTYHGPEFRVSARFTLDNQSSVKMGFNTMRQNIHLLSNTSAIAPTDSWKLSDRYIRPQNGGQASVGYYRNMALNTLEFSAEVYYRYMNNLLDYRSGASIILNENIEQDVLNTEGKAYGLELLLKKSTGALTGSLAYTYSRSLLRTSDEPSIEKINDGEFYPSNFDQPHHATLVANYELSKRVNVSLNGNYSTGRPVTLPIAKFEYAGSERVYFSDRNAYRILDYFRLDLSVNLEGNHKVRKLAHSSWSVGVYNVLGRSNPYSVYYAPVDGQLRGYQLSIFARPIPFITYNFKF